MLQHLVFFLGAAFIEVTKGLTTPCHTHRGWSVPDAGLFCCVLKGVNELPQLNIKNNPVGRWPMADVLLGSVGGHWPFFFVGGLRNEGEGAKAVSQYSESHSQTNQNFVKATCILLPGWFCLCTFFTVTRPSRYFLFLCSVFSFFPKV